VSSQVAQPASRPLRSQPRIAVETIGDALLDVRTVLLIAAALICGTLWWCLHQSYNVLLSYADAPTHLNLARRVSDDLHPGLGQLGAYWLPLAHVIELPFVWNDALWRSGLAGAIPSMGCYLLSVWLIYRLAQLATDQKMPAVIAALAFAANPNILYLHVLPMFEPAIIASMLLAVYLLARWLNVGGFAFLIGAAAAMSVACTSRYEIWSVALASAPVVAIALWQQGCRAARLRARLMLYLLLAWYGMALWVLWNLSLQGDPIYFLHPSFNKGLNEAALAVLTKRHVQRATAYVFYSIADNSGWILIALCAAGLWRFATTFGTRARGLWLYLLAMPAAFDIFYLWFKGTPPITVPELYPGAPGNIRYGVVSLPFLCLAAAYLACRPENLDRIGAAVRLLVPLRWVWSLGQLVVLAAVLIQPVMLLKSHDGVVSFTEPNRPDYLALQRVRTATAQWLSRHYDGGLILMSTFKGADRIILDSGLEDHVFVHEGSQNTWKCALKRPQRWVRWVVLYKRGDGAVSLANSQSVGARQYFRLVQSIGGSDGYWIFRRNSTPWPPKHLLHRSPCD
jgi:hypothetical protein